MTTTDSHLCFRRKKKESRKGSQGTWLAKEGDIGVGEASPEDGVAVLLKIKTVLTIFWPTREV